MIVRSSIRTVREASPIYLLGRRLDHDELSVAVEVNAVFTTDEAAAEFGEAVKELLERA